MGDPGLFLGRARNVSCVKLKPVSCSAVILVFPNSDKYTKYTTIYNITTTYGWLAGAGAGCEILHNPNYYRRGI